MSMAGIISNQELLSKTKNKGKSLNMQAYADRKFRRDRNTQHDAQSEVERGFRMGIQVHIMQ